MALMACWSGLDMRLMKPIGESPQNICSKFNQRRGRERIREAPLSTPGKSLSLVDYKGRTAFLRKSPSLK